jgi:hypothetical protein
MGPDRNHSEFIERRSPKAKAAGVTAALRWRGRCWIEFVGRF